MKIYCLKCKDHREITDPEQVTMKNGRPAVKAKCVKCASTVFRIGAIPKEMTE